MTKRVFNTSERALRLQIDDKEFLVDVDEAFVMQESESFVGRIQELDTENVEEISKLMNEIMAFIDTLLGEGSVESIFKGNRVSILTLMDLLEFIILEISEDKNQKLDKYRKRK